MKNLSSENIENNILEIIKQLEVLILSVKHGLKDISGNKIAWCDSCLQLLNQAVAIQAEDLRRIQFLRVISEAELVRNQVMFSFKESVEFLLNQPNNFVQKVIRDNPSKFAKRLVEIKLDMLVITQASIIQINAYHSLGEIDAVTSSAEYYANFMSQTILKSKKSKYLLYSDDPKLDDILLENLERVCEAIQSLKSK